ncbi:MAG: hypothetical protein IV100_28080 [Myxococcales bacterium]|nr:hypothetical protein [Myxococcales bacterium]
MSIETDATASELAPTQRDRDALHERRRGTSPSLQALGTPPFARRVALVILIAAQLGILLAVGGVHAEVIGAGASLLLLGFAIAYVRSRGVTIDAFGALLLGMTAVTALQIVPLPTGWVELLSPRTASTALLGAAALGNEAPTRIPLSLDPRATALMLTWMVAMTTAYLLARRVADRENDRNRLLMAIPLFGLVVMAVGLVHAVIGEASLFGFVEIPKLGSVSTYGAVYVSTLVNPNHLAAFLNLGAPIALSLATTETIVARQRLFWGVVSVVLIAGAVLTGSRAGILCSGLGAVLVIISSRQDAGGPNLRKLLGVLGLGLVLFLVLASPAAEQLATIPALSELFDQDERGVRHLGAAVLKGWWAVGVGRGAFSLAQTQLNHDISELTFTHAHNTPLQVLIDYGIPIGLTAIILGALLLARPLRRALEFPLTRGGAIALLVLLLHNLVDFNLDILAVAVVTAVMVGVMRADQGGIRLGWVGPSVIALLAAAMLPVLVSRAGFEPGHRRDAAIEADPRAAADAFPADAYAFFAAGAHERSLPLLDHAALLAPGDARIALARAMLLKGDARWAELRRGLKAHRSYLVRDRIFALITTSARTSADLRAALPDGTMAATYLKSVREPRPALLRALPKAFPDSADVLEAVAAVELRRRDFDALEATGTRLMALEIPSGYRYLAEVYRSRGKHYEAFQLFLSAGDGESVLAAADLALAAGDGPRAIDVLRSAKVPAKQLKSLRLLENRARALMTDGRATDMRLRFEAEVFGPKPLPASLSALPQWLLDTTAPAGATLFGAAPSADDRSTTGYEDELPSVPMTDLNTQDSGDDDEADDDPL